MEMQRKRKVEEMSRQGKVEGRVVGKVEKVEGRVVGKVEGQVVGKMMRQKTTRAWHRGEAQKDVENLQDRF